MDKLEKVIAFIKKRWQRSLNSILIWIALSLTLGNQTGILNLGDQLTSLELQYKREQQEISQLVADEGYRRCPYSDSLGITTVGFGHMSLPSDVTTGCLTPSEAIGLLRDDYNNAKLSVEKRYPWADGEVKLVIVNMTFQMGANGVSKFKNMLAALKDEDYDRAAAEMLDSKWASQTESRAVKLSGRILNLGN